MKITDQTHFRVCNYCEAMCGVQVDYTPEATTPESIFRVRADKQDTFSHGSMCPKAASLGAIQLDPSRLKYPVRKIKDDAGNVEWQQIEWEEAYDLVSTSLSDIRSTHGSDSIATYLGNPIVHNLGMMMTVKMLTKAIGSKNVFSATSMDQLPHHFAAHFMFGHEFRIPVPDIDRTEHMVIMGANPMASNGSIMTSAGVSRRLKEIRERGGKLIVIDPRKTETGKIADEHYFIKPAHDLYFLLAFLHILYRDKLVQPDARLLPHFKDLDLIEGLVSEFSPDKVTELTGMAAADIEHIVADYAAADTAVLYGRMGLSTQTHGGLCHWLINLINIISGNFDTTGGMMFPAPAIDLARTKQREMFGRWKSRVRGLSEFAGELPVSTMADELLTKGKGQVRAFITICGNPVLSSPSGHRLDEALENIDFMVSVDNYINETTRHADLILPTPTGLEIDHYDLIFNTISVTNNVKFSQAMVPVAEDRPFDWQILKELSDRMTPNGLGMVDRFLTPRRLVNIGLMIGPYGKLSHPKRWLKGLSLNKVLKAKHGISLGPLQAGVPHSLKTLDKKIHLAPSVFLERLSEVVSQLDQAADGETQANEQDKPTFRLIGRRNVFTNNSWMHQVPNLNKSKQVRCTAMLNPADAKQLGLQNGDQISVSSRAGEIELPVEITDTMMTGVVSIPHGFGHTKSGTRVPIAESKPGVSVNDITDSMRIDELTGNAAFSGLPVSITRIGGGASQAIKPGKPLTILYGSQSGNGEMIALDVATSAAEHDLLPKLLVMSEASLDDLQSAERLVIIVSTFGEGELPDNARTLWKDLAGAAGGSFEHTHFAVLGLGDRSYDDFCQAGIDFDEKLSALGGQRTQDLVKCDVDYADAADQWIANVLPQIGLKGDQQLVEPSDEYLQAQNRAPTFNRANPMTLVLAEKRRLSSEQSGKQTMHYTLDFDEDVQYTPGDSLYILPVNSPQLVQRWLDFLSLSTDDSLMGYQGSDQATSAGDVLRKALEIRLPNEKTLKLLAKHCPDLDLASSNIRSQDLLEIVQQCKLAPEDYPEFIASLPSLLPRAYSISSSPAQTPKQVSLTVATVRYGNNDQHHGVASTYFADTLQTDQAVQGWFVGNQSFSLPADETAPVIMIGPGTGIAPFRSFLIERQQLKHSGDNWLFFGDRQQAHDFLYRDELNQLQENGVLTRMDLAFSRDQEEKIYVQDRMCEKAEALYQWLENGAYIYICGDAEYMAKSVDTALHDVVSEQGKLNPLQTKEYIADLVQSGRYVKDVY